MKYSFRQWFGSVFFSFCLAAALAGCSKHEPASSSAGAGAGGTSAASSSPKSEAASGTIRIDGSSTVFPISTAVAEEFQEVQPDVKVPVSLSGTSGGMKGFVRGEIDICDASRPIKDAEVETCKKAGIDFIELTVAFDGLAVVANTQNDWCDCLTVEELKKIWHTDATEKVMKWSDVNPDWPDEEFKLYGPGTDSGTFEYFTGAICGEEGASRPDYQPSENDNMLVRGVVAEKGGLGYFGYAYYAQNKDTLKLIAVNDGSGCVAPSDTTVRDGSYKPLSRPLFIYVRKSSLERPEVAEFVQFYMKNAARLSADVGYVPVSSDIAQKNDEILAETLK